MALDPLFVSCFALGWPVAVGSKCRRVRLLSRPAPFYAPTVKLPQRTAYLISAHAYAKTPPGIWHFSPPKHLPHPPKTSYHRHNSLVCVYGRQISETVIFGGHVYGEGANAQHALHINAVTILLVYNFFFHTVRNGICRVTNLLQYLQNTVTVEKRVVKHSLKSL